MKKISIIVIILFALTGSMAFAQDSRTDELKAIAQDLVKSLSEGDSENVIKYFDSTVKATLPPAQLEQLWGQLTGQFGTYSGQTGVRTEKIPDFDIVFVTMAFDKMKLDTKLVFDKDNKVAGFFFAPAPPDKEPEPADYVKADSFTESEVTFGEPSWELPGTLTVPKGDGPFPAIILVHGSGPNDRDETIGPNKPFRDLAWGLASKGIAVLRYDKRTKVHGMKIGQMDEFTVKEETVDDAVLAYELLRKTDRIDPDRIFILGHSLGAMVMPRIGLKTPEAAGLIFMAGNTRPLEDLIVEQYEYIYSLDSANSEENRIIIDSLKKQVAFLKSDSFTKNTPREQTPMGANAAYWLDLKSYNQVETAQKLAQPLLILQGERDYQVTMRDFDGWKKGLKDKNNVTFKSYPKLNHLFMTGEGMAVPDEYMREGHVDLEVIDDIVKWINSK